MAQNQNRNVQVQVNRSEASERSAEELRERAADTYAPLVDIYETEDGTNLVAELPGVKREDVKIEVDKGVLTLSGTTSWEVPGEGYTRTFVGFTPGAFFRAFALSDEVDRDKITASFANGVVVLKLPKAEAAKPRKIEISSGD